MFDKTQVISQLDLCIKCMKYGWNDLRLPERHLFKKSFRGINKNAFIFMLKRSRTRFPAHSPARHI